MKRLILVRHAKSSWQNPELRDFDRPLNNRGLRSAPMMGRRLAEQGLRPQRIVSSPARRAWQTAEMLALEVGCRIEDIVAADDIFEADLGTLLQIVSAFDDAWNDVMLVGHNPGITDLAGHLAGQDFGNLPTCAICSLSLPIEGWTEVPPGCGDLDYFDYPKNPAFI